MTKTQLVYVVAYYDPDDSVVVDAVFSTMAKARRYVEGENIVDDEGEPTDPELVIYKKEIL